MKKTVSVIVLLALIVGILSGISVLASDDTTNPVFMPQEVTLDRKIDIVKNVSENFDRERCFYDLSTEDPEWMEFQTSEAMRQAIHLDDDVFANLSTEEVFRAVLEYPLIHDLMAFNTPELAVERVSEHCTALRIFIRRPDAQTVLRRATENVEGLTAKVEAVTIQKSLFNLYLNVLDQYFLISNANMNSGDIGATPLTSIVYYIKTPNNSSIKCIRNSEFSQEAIENSDRRFRQQYSQAQFVSSSSLQYNCHAYAWHIAVKQSNGEYVDKQCWMDDPSPYMTDGSYTRVININYASHAFYLDDNHSAMVYDATGNSLANALFISKWATGPVMIHKKDYGPYTGRVSLWYR